MASFTADRRSRDVPRRNLSFCFSRHCGARKPVRATTAQSCHIENRPQPPAPPTSRSHKLLPKTVQTATCCHTLASLQHSTPALASVVPFTFNSVAAPAVRLPSFRQHDVPNLHRVRADSHASVRTRCQRFCSLQQPYYACKHANDIPPVVLFTIQMRSRCRHGHPQGDGASRVSDGSQHTGVCCARP